jgi:hypothetical protein
VNASLLGGAQSTISAPATGDNSARAFHCGAPPKS